MPEPEKPAEPKYVDLETAPIELPQYGDTLPAKVVRLGMTTAKEVFKEDAKNPEQKILMVFFEAEDGTHGKTPLSYYGHPSQRSKIAKFVREFGQPKVGMAVTIIRDENGYWGLKL
jgi:hypothetical protein